MAAMTTFIPRTAALTTALCGALLLLLLGASNAFAAPANDNLSAAQPVGAVPAEVAADATGATTEAGEPEHAGSSQRSVWYSWTPNFTGTAVIDVCDTGFSDGQPSVSLAVYTGTNYANLSDSIEDGSSTCVLRVGVANGINYKIAVDFRNEEGPFTFRLRKLAPPANDNFAGAIQIPAALPQSTIVSTIDAGWQSGEPSLGGSERSRSVWYRWTPTTSQRVRFEFCDFEVRSGASNKTFGVYTGSTLATLDEVGHTSNTCSVDLNVTANVTYRIAFSGDFMGEGQVTLNLIQATPPVNDNFGAATPVGPGLPVTVEGDNDFATDQPNEPTHGGIGLHGFYSVWYSWTAPVTATVKVRGCSAEYSPHLGLYTGNTLASLVEVGTPPPFGPYCAKELNAVQGTTYRIAVGGNVSDNARGPFTLDIHLLDRPANDDFADAAIVGPALPATIAGTTADATVETDEPGFANSNAEQTVWYRWTPSKSGNVRIDACQTDHPVKLVAFTGNSLASLFRVGEAGEKDLACAGSRGTALALTVQAGQAYNLQVDHSLSEVEADFTLAFTSLDPPVVDPPEPPVVDPPVVTPPAQYDLKRAIKTCQKKFKGKSKKMKRKRANCIRKAKLKAAVGRCKSTSTGPKRVKCIRSARKKYAAPKPKKGAGRG